MATEDFTDVKRVLKGIFHPPAPRLFEIYETNAELEFVTHLYASCVEDIALTKLAQYYDNFDRERDFLVVDDKDEIVAVYWSHASKVIRKEQKDLV